MECNTENGDFGSFCVAQVNPLTRTMVIQTTSLRLASITLLTFSICTTGRGQLSAYVSGTYGYQSNPLYNHEHTGDHVRSTYLEAGYSSQQFQAKYAGGLTLFKSLTERNFLDHTLLLSLSFPPQTDSSPAVTDSSANNQEEDAGDVETPLAPDSLGTFGQVSAKVASRHDKSAFRDYDNTAAELAGFVRRGFAGWYLRLEPDGGYRTYPFTRELSNTSALLAAEIGIGDAGGLRGGLRALTGVKHFTVAAFDTSRFEPVRTYVTVTKPGSGKGSAKITVKESSGKSILANADVRTAAQLAGSAFLGCAWETGSLITEILYRHNLSPSARVLARTPGNATINDDLYNDFFSYQGPQATLTFRQTLSASVQAALSLEYRRKRFGAPAFDLDGAQIAGVRIDRRTEIEGTVSRYFPLSSNLGFDLSLFGTVVRNESNDIYNDFSGWSLGLSLGIGF